jgi:structural maintenance of chromosomes protein 5
MFVKHEKENGFIEIELKGNVGKPNVVFKRTLNARSKTSSFTIDGRSATGKEVTAAMHELNIQVGNLWYVRINIGYCFF